MTYDRRYVCPDCVYNFSQHLGDVISNSAIEENVPNTQPLMLISASHPASILKS